MVARGPAAACRSANCLRRWKLGEQQTLLLSWGGQNGDLAPVTGRATSTVYDLALENFFSRASPYINHNY
jgi:hypothetical protein